MANDLGGFLFNSQKRPNRVSGVEAVAANGDFDPNTDRYFNPAAWTDPGPLQFGNAARRDDTVRDFPNYSEDLNIFKVFPMADQRKLRFEASIGNLFNRVFFCSPNTNWSSAAFGSVNTQCNQPRSVQFALRFDFRRGGLRPAGPPIALARGDPEAPLRSGGRAFGAPAPLSLQRVQHLAASHTTV